MAYDGGVSALQWGHNDPQVSITGSPSQNSIRQWLTSTITQEDAKHEPQREAAEPLRRNPSGDDDLALGVEASLYGKQGVRTVQDFLRRSRKSPTLSRWNSISSTASGHSGPLSIMDILNLWNDDPEEFLLDLGFGCDEPDLSGRIPARFINYQSQARGINLQVFLEAQKSRMDLENPDVSNRFRQLEVLQQVTTAFSSLVGSSSSPLKAKDLEKDMPPEARERRRRMGMLFRRASKKSLSQIQSQKALDLSSPDATSSSNAAPESLLTPTNLGDKKVPLKRLKPGHLETVGLSPLAEELVAGPDPQSQSHKVSFMTQDGTMRPGALRDSYPLTATSLLQRKKNQWQGKESFEMEEIHSFDDGSVTGSYSGGGENIVKGLIRTNSCQSDSSGFLEEPFVPSLPQQGSPGSDLIKALAGLSGGSTDSHSSERPSSPPPSYPHSSTSQPLSPSLNSSGVDKSLSPSASQELPSGLSPSSHPASPCLLKSDVLSSETDTSPDENQSLSGSLLQTDYQSPPLASSDCFTSLRPPTPPMQLNSLIKGSEDIEVDNKALPHLSDAEHTAYSLISNISSESSHSLSPNSDSSFPVSDATSSESSFGSPENEQSESVKEASDINASSPPVGLSSLLPVSPDLHPPVPTDFHNSSSLASPPLTESLSPNINQKDSDKVGLTETPAEITQFPSYQLDNDEPSSPSPPALDSSKFNKDCPTLPCPSPNLSTSPCLSNLSSQSQDPDGLIDPAAGKISDLTVLRQPANTDPAPTSPVQDVIHVKMDDLSSYLEDTLQRKEKGQGEGERYTDTEQTGDTDVYIPDTEHSLGISECSPLVFNEGSNLTNPQIPQQVPSNSVQEDLSAETKQEELGKVCKVVIKETESKSHISPLHYDIVKESSSIKADLIAIESLDSVFETSVDGSDFEGGEADAFFQQLDTEGQVFWAEPIQVSYSVEEFGTFEAFDGSPENSFVPKEAADTVLPAGTEMPVDKNPSSTLETISTEQSLNTVTDFLDTHSSLTQTPSPSPSPATDIKSLSRSVSVQMSSSPSSHIVHRKDVPYIPDPKHTLPSSILPLDTSTPFRAVQSWTDLHIQRNKTLSHEILDTIPNEVTYFTSAPEKIQRSAQMFSSTPSFPLQSKEWQSHDSLAGRAKNYRNVSVSVDGGLSTPKEKNIDRNGTNDEKYLWENNQATTVVCCCSCDRQCTCCSQKNPNKQQTVENLPYSLDELEEMMLCLQQFCSVLSNMEEQLSEDQAAVYGALSDQDSHSEGDEDQIKFQFVSRNITDLEGPSSLSKSYTEEKVRDIEELRRAVKHEAGELEKQLNELAHHYDDSLKMKMHRLLDEQSLLCSQLRVFLPGASNPASNRTVATQCSIMPWIAAGHMQSDPVSSWSLWKEDSSRVISPGLDNICESLGSSPTKADKMDIVGFLQRLKESLHHSLNTDSLE